MGFCLPPPPPPPIPSPPCSLPPFPILERMLLPAWRYLPPGMLSWNSCFWRIILVFFAGSAGNQRVKYIESKSAFSTICVSYVLSRVLVGDPRRLLKMRFLNVFFLRRICFVSSHLHELHRREPAAVEPPRLEHHPALARRQLPQLLLVQHWNFFYKNKDTCQKNMWKTYTNVGCRRTGLASRFPRPSSWPPWPPWPLASSSSSYAS